MRVAIFADTYNPQINGVANTLGKLVDYFERTGIEYKLLVPQYDTKESEENIERFYSLKFFLYKESRITLPNLFRVTKALDDFKPDIIHIMTEFNLGLTGLYYGKKHNIPTISNYTTNFSEYTNYYKIDFLKQAIWNYMKWFHNQNDITLCPSYTTKKLLEEHDIENTGIFSRGIDSGKFNSRHRSEELRKELGITYKFTFLYVGRISIEKSLDVLSESYRKINDKYPGETALVVTGDGPYLKKCKNIFPEGTIFTGFKRGEELAKIYASCDAFICPSATETFGNVVLEAMISGIPVIGADAGGVGEIIKDRDNGLKFMPGNVTELTKCMTEIFEDIELRNYIKENGMEYSKNRSWNKIFAKLLEIYENVLEKDMSLASIE